MISWTRPSPSYASHRFPCPLIRVHSPIIGSFIHCHGPAFLAATIRSPTYCRCDSTGLETTLDIPRGAAHLAHLDRASSPGRSRAQARGHPRRALCVHSSSVLIAAPQLSASSRHYTEISAEPLHATSSAPQGKIIMPRRVHTLYRQRTHHRRVQQGRFDVNLFDAGTSGNGGEMKGKGREGKGGEWERTNGTYRDCVRFD